MRAAFLPSLSWIKRMHLIGAEHNRNLLHHIDRARSDPLFRRRILQGHSVFATRISVNDIYRKVDCDILAKLVAEGYEPSGNWLVENLERLIPEAAGKSRPESCGAAP